MVLVGKEAFVRGKKPQGGQCATCPRLVREHPGLTNFSAARPVLNVVFPGLPSGL